MHLRQVSKAYIFCYVTRTFREGNIHMYILRPYKHLTEFEHYYDICICMIIMT